MDRWNVLHIFYHYPPVLSGYAKRSHEIVKHTASFAHSIILTPPLDKQKVPSIPFKESGVGEEIYRLRTPLPPIRHVGHRWLSRFLFEFLLRKVLRHHSIDLVHAHMPYIYALPALRLAKSRGLRTIYEVRGIWEESAVAEEQIAPHSRKYWRRQRRENKAMQCADKIVVLSEALKREMIKRGVPKEKIKHVPNAVDCSKFRPIPHSNKIELLYDLKGKVVLGYIGTLRKMEGLQNIISLLPKLLNQGIPLTLLIVGFGEYETILKKLVSDLKLESDVIFAGAIPPEEVSQYYSVMDIVLFPRLELKVTELVTPLKPLEAMAMGKCVFASHVGGLTEYCLDHVNSVLFDPQNKEDCLKKLKALIQNDSTRNKLGDKAHKWVKEHKDWKDVAQSYANLYHKLCPHKDPLKLSNR